MESLIWKKGKPLYKKGGDTRIFLAMGGNFFFRVSSFVTPLSVFATFSPLRIKSSSQLTSSFLPLPVFPPCLPFCLRLHPLLTVVKSTQGPLLVFVSRKREIKHLSRLQFDSSYVVNFEGGTLFPCSLWLATRVFHLATSYLSWRAYTPGGPNRATKVKR